MPKKQNSAAQFFSGESTPRRINLWRKFVGSFIPNWLMCRPEVSQGAKLAYGRLAQFGGRAGRCFPMQESLGKELGVRGRMARNYIRELESFHLIESVQHGNCTSNEYHFLDHPWMHDKNNETNCLSDRQKASGPDQQTNSVPTIEENQFERESRKHKHTHDLGPTELPGAVEQAIAVARELKIPEDFAAQEFHAKKAVGWRDGYGNSITSWRDHLQARWPVEQRKRTERRPTSRISGKRPALPPRQFAAADYNQSVKDF